MGENAKLAVCDMSICRMGWREKEKARFDFHQNELSLMVEISGIEPLTS